MNGFITLVKALTIYKKHTTVSVLFHFMTAIFTVVSIPLIIPFFQLLFDSQGGAVDPPKNWYQLDDLLHYGFGQLIDSYGQERSLLVICSALVVLFLIRNVMRYLASHYLLYARNGVLRDLRSSLYHAYQSLSMSQRKSMKKGQLLSMLSNDMMEIDHGMLKAVELIFKVPLIVVGSLIFMLWISVKLTLIAIALVLIALLVIGRLSHRLKRASVHAQESLGEMNVIADEYLTATKVIKTYGADSFFAHRFDKHNDDYFKRSNQMLRRRDLASPLSEFLAVVIITLLLWYGAHSVLDGRIYPASFFAFIFAFYSVVDPAKSFAREYYNVQKAQAALDRVRSFMTTTVPSSKQKAQLQSVSFNKEIEFSHLSFQYDDGDRLIFNSINLTIKKGEKIGVVGPSGIGKTTLFDLLLRFYTPTSGCILLDGVEVEQYSVEAYRQLFGIVTQDSYLFHMPIQSNISLANEAVSQQVITAAHIDFDRGQSHIGDQGLALSGGQRQRIAIARALHHDRSIILLDEPTSALDAEAEKVVLRALYEVFADRTIIMISHDVQLLREMDRIIEIGGDGQILHDGSYVQLYGDDHTVIDDGNS